MKNKGIPSLELLAIEFGVCALQNVKAELSGSKTMSPINISSLKILTDSSISLAWLNSYNRTFTKMNKQSVFVMNRLSNIERQCKLFPITFSFIAGKENPADYITRPTSYKILSKSCYWRGPDLSIYCDPNSFSLTVPYSNLEGLNELGVLAVSPELEKISESIIDSDDFQILLKCLIAFSMCLNLLVS